MSIKGNFQLFPISQIFALDHTNAENHPDCNIAHHKQYAKPLGQAAYVLYKPKNQCTKQQNNYMKCFVMQKKSACSLACCPASLCVHIASSALLTLSAMRRNLFYAERHDFTTLQEKHQ
jgi:hypothetical protein